MKLSIVIITYNEEENIGRTLASVESLMKESHGEIIVVDSASTDGTVEVARSHRAQVFVEEWKGYAAQKNSAIEKATGEWILSLDADEVLDDELQQTLTSLWSVLTLYEKLRAENSSDVMINDARADIEKHLDAKLDGNPDGFFIRRKNMFLGRWIRHGGFWPDAKLRLFRKTTGRFEDRAVHEDVKVQGATGTLKSGALVHYAYPTLSSYIQHMERYSSLGAEMAMAKGGHGFSLINIIARPKFTFFYNYFLRLGFLDGREGLLLHLYHAGYVSWKYAKVWELTHKK